MSCFMIKTGCDKTSGDYIPLQFLEPFNSSILSSFYSQQYQNIYPTLLVIKVAVVGKKTTYKLFNHEIFAGVSSSVCCKSQPR